MMTTPETGPALIAAAGQLRARLARLETSHAPFADWRERRAGEAVARFGSDVERLSPTCAVRMSQAERQAVLDTINGIIEAIESLISRQLESRRIARAQALAAHVYRLRRCAEALARGATPNPGVEDVRWELRIHRR